MNALRQHLHVGPAQASLSATLNLGDFDHFCACALADATRLCACEHARSSRFSQQSFLLAQGSFSLSAEAQVFVLLARFDAKASLAALSHIDK